MKVNKVVGVDIGNYRMKVAYVVKGQLKKFFYENIPDNAVKDGTIQYWDAMAQFLRDTFKEHGIRCRNVIFNVPMSGIYIRNVELPLMTVKQLELNLPFEFHDFISEDSGKYFYDYSVLERDDKSMKLLAVACSKELINKYRKLAKDAKLNPIGLVPGVIGLQRILQKHNQHFSVPAEKDYAILDLGDNSFKIHFFKHGIYDVTRSLEPGAREFAETISEINDTDIHISHLAEEDNLNNIQSHPRLVSIYESRAVEIMRALNFYSYSNTGNTIDALYCCGGGSNIYKLIKILAETLNLPVKPMSDLIANMDDDVRESFRTCPQSYGITIDPEVVYEPFSEDRLKEIVKHIEEYDRKQWERLESKSEAAAASSDAETFNIGVSSSMPESEVKTEETIDTAAETTEAEPEPLPTLGENDSYMKDSVTDSYMETSSRDNYAESTAIDNYAEVSDTDNYTETSVADSNLKAAEGNDVYENTTSVAGMEQTGEDETEETFHLDDSDDTVHRIDGQDEEYSSDSYGNSEDEYGSVSDDMPEDYHVASSEDIRNVEDDTNKTIEELTAQIMNGHFDL